MPRGQFSSSSRRMPGPMVSEPETCLRSLDGNSTRSGSPIRLRQSRANAPDKVIVVFARAFQIENAGPKIAITPGRSHKVVILEHGGAEFIVVGIAAFEEDQTPCCIRQRFWI